MGHVSALRGRAARGARGVGTALTLALVQCSGDRPAGSPGSPGSGDGGASAAGADGGGARGVAGETVAEAGGAGGLPATTDLDGSAPSGAPKIGAPGCGLAVAAFCDTFDGPSAVRGRGGDLDRTFWSAGRMMGTLTTTRAMGIGMAVIPQCRPGIPAHVWPDEDTLVCDPTADVASAHLLVAVAAQHYGQNGYRIRQPIDFAGRTAKIVFDAAVWPLSPLHGWVSFAITEDPISMPGYSVYGNDEGSIIPRNAVEVHFSNAPGSNGDQLSVRTVHVFRDFADTVYMPEGDPRAAYRKDKLNHYEFDVSETGIDVSVTPFSEDGRTFAAPGFTFHVDAALPFSRGWVHVSVHNHATMKYSQPSDGFPSVVDATVARIDNVGFDGPVLASYREYEVKDALVRFTEPNFQPLQDPYNPENVGYDVGYVVGDAAAGPKQSLALEDVDLAAVTRARLAFSLWVDGGRGGADTFAVRARFNGKAWRERKLGPEEVKLFTSNPTTVDASGAPLGDPHTQGRLGLVMDVPLEDLVPGHNTVELVTVNVPTSYPPVVCNLDLVLSTE